MSYPGARLFCWIFRIKQKNAFVNKERYVQNEFSVKFIGIDVTLNKNNPKKYVITMMSREHILTKWWFTFFMLEVLLAFEVFLIQILAPED